MSKHKTTTSDHWDVGGSGHNGENILHRVNKSQFTQAQAAQEDNGLIPGQNGQHPETPAPKGGNQRAGNATASSNSSKGGY
jgi:hypothetical protein